jgi:hypothetical protein
MNKEQGTMPTIAEIRLRYPHPVSQLDAAAPHGYCVGWAVSMAFSDAFPGWDTDLEDNHFPGEYDLARMLADINPALDDGDADSELEATKAWEFADAMTESNDIDRDFEAAWAFAAHALAYRKPERGAQQ